MGAPPTDDAAMAAALTAARDGRRGANPLVGATIRAADGRTVTGRHLGAGTAHAEVDAIAAALAQLRGRPRPEEPRDGGKVAARRLSRSCSRTKTPEGRSPSTVMACT